MITRDSLIKIGRYNKPHGVYGEISATLDVDTDLLARFSCLVSDIDGIFVPFFVTDSREKSAQVTLLSIDGVTTDGQASMLVNKDIFVLRQEYDELPADDGQGDEYPLDYFVGFKIFDNDGTPVGDVVGVDDTTINWLFVVETPDGGQVHVPAADELIEDIDMNSRAIVMNLPDGLLNL